MIQKDENLIMSFIIRNSSAILAFGIEIFLN